MVQPSFRVNRIISGIGLLWNAMPRKRQNWPRDSKWPASCWVRPMGPRGFFVCVVMLHMCTNLCSCRWNVPQGLLFKGHGQGVWPRPSTKVMWYIQGRTFNIHMKLHGDVNLYTKVKCHLMCLYETSTYTALSGRKTLTKWYDFHSIVLQAS